MFWKAGELFHERYKLLHRLSSTNSKQTWLVEDRATQQNCVLKALYFSSDEQVWQNRKLLEREAATLKSIAHPNIPKFIKDFWLEMSEGGYFCLVNEYIPGESLADLVVNKGTLSLSRVKEIAAEILAILETLHNYAPPVIHRDIKPANLILRTADQQVCLIDFGSVQTDTTAGKTLTIVGTYGYMAPEQFAGQTSPASDLYSLGATLLYLLSGLDPADLPRKGSQIIVDEEIVDDRTFRKWLEQLLMPDCNERFKTALEAKKALLKGAEKTELRLSKEHLPVEKGNSQLKINFDSLQVSVPYSSNFNFSITIFVSIISVVFGLLLSVSSLKNLDHYTGSLPLPLYILNQLSLLILFGAPLVVAIRREKLLFKKDKRQYIIYWGFLFRKSYQLSASFQVAIDYLDAGSKRHIMSGDQFITLIDNKGRRFPLGKFNEEDAELLVKELKKWQEK
ncbi:MAG: serine/threonine protein kinase [Anaerolineae bacterium]|nr:serine/threonine protein kinase [Gloeobacterales cyanobacterium ES-bin-313]